MISQSTMRVPSSPICSGINNEFTWREMDLWTEVLKHLDGEDLVRLSSTSRWFRTLITDDSIWRHTFLSHSVFAISMADLDLPRLHHDSWSRLYATVFDKRRAYGRVVLGGFALDTSVILLTAMRPPPSPAAAHDIQTTIQTSGACLLTNARRGLWITERSLENCNLCNKGSCEGTIHVITSYHYGVSTKELCDYTELGQHTVPEAVATAAAAILTIKMLHQQKNCNNIILQQLDDFTLYKSPSCLGVSTLLKENNGMVSTFESMVKDGQTVSVRIAQRIMQ